MTAIVDVAATLNTYVTVHALTNSAIQQCLDAGVQCIEHGHILSGVTLQMMRAQHMAVDAADPRRRGRHPLPGRI